MRRDAGSHIRSRIERMLDLLGVPVFTVEDPTERELEAIAPTTALQRQIRKIINIRIGIRTRVVGVEEVGGRKRVGGVELTHVCSEKERARDGDAHHFVGVDGDGVREVASL